MNHSLIDMSLEEMLQPADKSKGRKSSENIYLGVVKDLKIEWLNHWGKSVVFATVIYYTRRQRVAQVYL